MKNLTWKNPEQLFVAQELINKVKSKCCGIKVYTEKSKEEKEVAEVAEQYLMRIQADGFLRNMPPDLQMP